jgi:iron complex transport system substrate-binding protein
MKTYLLAVFLLTALPAASSGAHSVIIDDSGRSVEVNGPFKRIISLYGAHTENLFALGLDREIIGVGRNESFPPRALERPVFSYREDPEKFLAARPDLVLARPMIVRGQPQLIDRLEKSGITVVSLQPNTVTDMYEYWRILGLLTGREEAAAAMTDRFKEAVSSLTGLTRNVNPKKKVYFEAIHDKIKTFSPDSMAIFALEAAGGINVAADAPPVRGTNIAAYGIERLLSRAGEIDIYLAQTGTMNRTAIETIPSRPGFSAIRAIRENRIYSVEETIVARPTSRLLLGVFEIGRILYPEIFEPHAREILRKAGVL